MTTNTYEAPSISEIGSLHELTLQAKDLTGSDGIVLAIPGQTPIGLGPASGP